MSRVSSVLGVLVLAAVLVQGQAPSPDGLWQPIAGSADRIGAFSADLGQARPVSLAAFRLDIKRLVATLAKAGPELNDSSPTITMPMPNGSYVDFRVQETEVMTRELAASLSFKTYRGQGIRNPRVTTRFEYGPEGLRALVFTTAGRVFVEPVTRPEPAYVSYAARPSTAGGPPQAANNPPRCQLTTDEAHRMRARAGGRRPDRSPTIDPPGSLLRTYRLAVGATGEYVHFHGGTVDKAARAIGSTVQRINEVYENDLGVTFRLVPNLRDLIHTDPDRDPYTNDNADKLLSENQRFLDARIGTASYDIGHVFSTGAGGKAFAGLCDSTYKAQGATGKSDPVGDPFDIDYVAHEMGHQLGGNHTFNSTVGSCGGGNRFPDTAFEPGSGSTVLAYAGICNAADLQPHSHSYFHTGTLGEIREYLVAGDGRTCGTRAKTGNTPPSVTVPASAVTIPVGTPFRLAASARDAEERDLLFTSEQVDRGASSPPEGDADGHPRPLFRSYEPSPTATRMFPALDVIQSGKPRIGEMLPRTPRQMVVRITVRDAARPAGGFGVAEVAVKVAGSGPLTIKKPAAGATVAAGSRQDVLWTVNGTDRGDVACSNVAVRLSLDDGATVAHELNPSTPNDGAESVVIPAAAKAARARILVECVTQPFFAVSEPFTIQPHR